MNTAGANGAQEKALGHSSAAITPVMTNAGGARATWSPAAATRAQEASNTLSPAAAMTAWNGDGEDVE